MAAAFGAIVLGELVTGLMLAAAPPMPLWASMTLDAVVSVAAILPILVFLVLLPLGRNLAERDAAVDSVRKVEEQLRATLDSTADGILAVDDAGKILHANRRFAELWRIPKPLVERGDDKALLEFVLEQLVDPGAFIAKVEALYGTDAVDADTLTFTDGRVFGRFSVPMLLGEARIGRVWSFRDVTVQRRDELEREVMHDIAQGVATSSDLDDLLRLMHRALQRVVEAENCFVALHQEQTGLFSFPYFSDEHDERPIDPVELARSVTAYVFRNGEPLLLSPEVFRRLNEQHEVEMVGSPAASWMGVPLRTPSGMIGVLVLQHYGRENAYTERDLAFLAGVGSQMAVVIERRLAEQAAAELEDQLQQAQKMETVGRLAGGVAHDFNNMLGVIIGHAELALSVADPGGPLHEDLAEIHKAATRSAELTRQLLAYARRQRIVRKVVDLNATVPPVLTMLRRLLGENVALAWTPAAGVWPVSVDQSQLEQTLTNLCVNARDAIDDVGTVRIATANAVIDARFCAALPDATPGEYVRLTVADDGRGIGAELLPHLFEPFFTTKGVGKGTGLGLATVYGAVRQNGGFITVDSAPGEGTTFGIHFPRYTGELKPEGRPRALTPALGGRETILVVEDEPTVLQLAAKALEAQGYRVLVANRPGEAIRLATEHADAIDLLLTDVVMPEMSGRDLVNLLLPANARLNYLFMSGFSEHASLGDDLLADEAHFIAKPFGIAALMGKVRTVLDLGREANTP
jgi:signal transduction histidine kinase/CheY-like chemotaxis protein/PAS domain-containing protein